MAFSTSAPLHTMFLNKENAYDTRQQYEASEQGEKCADPQGLHKRLHYRYTARR